MTKTYTPQRLIGNSWEHLEWEEDPEDADIRTPVIYDTPEQAYDSIVELQEDLKYAYDKGHMETYDFDINDYRVIQMENGKEVKPYERH